MKANKKNTPLQGLKVLDFSLYGPVPYSTMILGDLGAEVIRVQGAAWDLEVAEFPDFGTPFDVMNRNKKSIQIDLKKEEGKTIFHKLAREADVIVEGFRPGVTKRLGIDYATLKEMNPRLIYCALTGYGQNGPYKDFVGHDINYIAHGGILGIMTRPDLVPGNIMADMACGTQAVVGILSAVVARQTTGAGQFIDLAMADGVVYMISHYVAGFLENGSMPMDEDRTTVGAMPFYNVYKTKDGKYISIASSEPKFFKNLCEKMGCAQFVPYENNKFRKDEIRQFLTKSFLTKTRDEWFAILSETDTAVAKVNSIEDLIADPQVRSREMIVELDHPQAGTIKQVGIPFKFSATPGNIRKFSPKSGEDTKAIMVGLGYTEAEIDALLKNGTISVSKVGNEGQ